VWTVEEANAALPRVTALIGEARDGMVKVTRRNGHAKQGSRSLDAVLDELAADGIVLRDVARGLIDFPAVAPSGRQYWLCWVAGEEAVTWWHWPEDGFPGRTPLSSPPA
jgi:hypothetical protein